MFQNRLAFLFQIAIHSGDIMLKSIHQITQYFRDRLRFQIDEKTLARRRLQLESLEAKQLLAADLIASCNETAFIDEPAALVASESFESLTPTSAESFQRSAMMNSGHQHGDPNAAALISEDQATHRVVASGNWSNPSTWENGELPDAGARILVPKDLTLTVDSVIQTEFKTLGIHGTLRFDQNVDTEIHVDTIVSMPGGRFEMGTATQPISAGVTAKVVFADDGAIDRNWDPTQLSRGALLQGPVEIYGQSVTHQAQLEVHSVAGDTQLVLSSVPSQWNAGDQIVITGTQGSTSDEIRTIQSIQDNIVELDRALELDHVAPQSGLSVYVANTTRNVQFSSENPDTAHRGHIMFMHNANVDVNHASFVDLGRTDKTQPLDDILFEFAEDVVGNVTSAGIDFTTVNMEANNIRGRYAVHFHRGGVDPSQPAAQIKGSVVLGSPGWGFVNHSSNVDMVNNVAYGVHGVSFYTEAGDEIGSMVGNLAIRTVSPTFTLDDEGAIDPDLRADVQDFGVDGDGFWLSGHMVSVKNNVAAGASGHGIIIWSDGLVEADRGRTTVNVANVKNGHLIQGRETIPTWWAPMAEIEDNEAFGATIGFRSRYVHSSLYLGERGSAFHEAPSQEYVDTLKPTVDGLLVWGSRDGVLLNYNERMSIKNARIVGIGAPYVQNGGTADTGVGIDMYNEVSRGPGVIENVTVEGFNMGILASRHDHWMLTNLTLRNTTDLLITEARAASRQLEMNNIRFESLADTAVADQAGQRQNIRMQANIEPDSQPFWFLLKDRITLDGQAIYFNEQADSFSPTGELHPLVPNEFEGLTNAELFDRYGTSFGGALIPADAQQVDFIEGGVIGSLPAAEPTWPPLYDIRDSLDGEFVLVDPGTLTNFDGNGTGGGGDGGQGDGDDDDDGEDGQDGDDDGQDGDGGQDGDDDDDQDGDDDQDEDGDDGEEDDDEDGEDGDGEDDEDGQDTLQIQLPESDESIRVILRNDQIIVRSGDDVSRTDLEDQSELVIRGTAGDDRVFLNFQDDGISQFDRVQVDLGEGNDFARVAKLSSSFEGDFQINGGDGDDRLVAKKIDAIFEIYGQAGDDRIVGGSGDDMLYGGDGDDRILGGSGDDQIDAGQGNNFVNGQAGEDLLIQRLFSDSRLNDKRLSGEDGTSTRHRGMESALIFNLEEEFDFTDLGFDGDVEIRT